jgi:putative component of membrane protein insertase Oxa1/YidC/SpoIIIJ protein YidD
LLEYVILALEKYGAMKGLAKAAGRLWRCRAGRGGYDPP